MMPNTGTSPPRSIPRKIYWLQKQVMGNLRTRSPTCAYRSGCSREGHALPDPMWGRFQSNLAACGDDSRHSRSLSRSKPECGALERCKILLCREANGWLGIRGHTYRCLGRWKIMRFKAGKLLQIGKRPATYRI